MSYLLDRLSPGQHQSAPGQRGSKQSRTTKTHCAIHDDVLSCLGVSNRVLNCLFQVLYRWNPTIRDGQIAYLESYLVIQRAQMTSGCVETCGIAGTEDNDRH